MTETLAKAFCVTVDDAVSGHSRSNYEPRPKYTPPISRADSVEPTNTAVIAAVADSDEGVVRASRDSLQALECWRG